MPCAHYEIIGRAMPPWHMRSVAGQDAPWAQKVTQRQHLFNYDICQWFRSSKEKSSPASCVNQVSTVIPKNETESANPVLSEYTGSSCPSQDSL